MINVQPNFFKNSVQKGSAISKAGAAEAILKTHKAITKLRVIGDKNIQAKIIWTNDEPTITIKWIGTTTT